MQEFAEISNSQQMQMKGGTGNLEYTMRYGDFLPDDCSYDPIADVVYWDCVSYGSGYTGSGSYTVTEICSMCDMETYGQRSGEPVASGMDALFHYFGLHETLIIRDTVYN